MVSLLKTRSARFNYSWSTDDAVVVDQLDGPCSVKGNERIARREAPGNVTSSAQPNPPSGFGSALVPKKP